jgi:hypothetical protein
MLRWRTYCLAGLIALAAPVVYGMPPATGAQWWSTDPSLDCTAYHALIYEVPLAAGGKGYACGVTGTFTWLAAGGNWRTSIRVAAPAAGAIGVQYVFFDEDGNRVSMDTISNSAPASGDTIGLALNANQPSEVQLLGASRDAPGYNPTQTGSVFSLFLCPDAVACATVLPQLLYSAAPLKPWLLSVPIAWDSSFSALQPSGLSTRWWATGSNSGAQVISFAIHNQASAPVAYTVRVFDSGGALVGQAVTPLVPGSNGVDEAGGTRGFLLADVVQAVLPVGILKVIIEGPGPASACFLQFSGESATSLETMHDLAPVAGGGNSLTAVTNAAGVRRYGR